MLLRRSILSMAVIAFSSTAMAQDATKDAEVQDMSDPLAVYTQAGFGYTDKGLNLKIGQTYDTGSDTTMGMNVLEVKASPGMQWAGAAVTPTTVLTLFAFATLVLI